MPSLVKIGQLNFIKVFSSFHYYLPLEKTRISFTYGCFALGLVEIGPVVLERIFFNVYSLFHSYLPLKKGETLRLCKFKSTLPKDDLCQVWLKLAQWFWGWKRKKFTYRRMDRRRRTGDKKSSLELSAEVSWKYIGNTSYPLYKGWIFKSKM